MMQVVPHNHSQSLKRQLETEVSPPKRISQELILHSPIEGQEYVPPALLTEEHFQFLQDQITYLKDIIVSLQLSHDKLLHQMQDLHARKDTNPSPQHHLDPPYTILPPISPIDPSTNLIQQPPDIIPPTLSDSDQPSSSKIPQWTTVSQKKPLKLSKPTHLQQSNLSKPAVQKYSSQVQKKITKSENRSHLQQPHLPPKLSPASVKTGSSVLGPSQTSKMGPAPEQPPGSSPIKPTYLAVATSNSNRLKKALQSVSNQLDYLLKQPLPVERVIDNIVSVVLTTTLSRKALSAPITAWKALINTISNHSPLMISIINSTTAEVFMDSRHLNNLINNLPPTIVKMDNVEMTNTFHIQRRAKTYLKGYFKTMRLSALQHSTRPTPTSRTGQPAITDILYQPFRNISLEKDNSVRQKTNQSTTTPQSSRKGRRRGSTVVRNCLNLNPSTYIPINNLPPITYDTSLLLSILQLDVYTIKSFPKQLRHNISNIFTSHLKNIILNPSSIPAWIEFLILPKCLLQRLPSFHKAYKLSSRKRKGAEREFLHNLIRQWEESTVSRDNLIRDLLSSSNCNSPQLRKPNTELSNIQRCMRLAREDGNYSKAIKSLHSHGIAPQCQSTNEALQEKHPSHIPLPKPTSKQSLQPPKLVQIDKDEILQALRSFPKGSGCGKTGLRISHLMEMYGGQNVDFLNSFTLFIQLLANGNAPDSLAPFIANASLIPLLKKDNVSIRPIAVGEIIRRITSKILMAKVKDAGA